MAKYLNLGIVAHVDAGKTSLTERLLYAAGAIAEVGSVDAGNTHTDSMALEQARGITIKSAVVSFAVGDVTINLIDTPGHPDFIAEVERVLNVLDGAILVVSAVEGVQAQTRILLRTLNRLGIPTLIFVNKIDRAGARFESVLRDIAEKLTTQVVALGSVADPGTNAADFAPHGADDIVFRAQLIDLLTRHDDALLTDYVEDERAITPARLSGVLAEQTARSLTHPVFAGSATTGAGIDLLIAGITDLLPATADHPEGPAAGTVFKVERGAAGEKVAYVRMFSGRLRMRERLPLERGRGTKITALRLFDRGGTVEEPSVSAGQIAKVWGLRDVQIGDRIGGSRDVTDRHYFAPPTLETVIEPRDPGLRGQLYAALGQLAEQDPLINVRRDDARHEIFASLYGEVQKQVIETTLATEYGIEVEFHQSTVLCIERPIRTGSSVDHMSQADNPFQATVGLRVTPGPIDSGVRFELGIERGSLPFSFIRAIEETVYETLRQGLHGWRVVDCTVTLTHSGYVPPPPYGWSKVSSSGSDFRHLTPLVLMDALIDAGTAVYEPSHRYRLEIPTGSLALVIPVLNGLRAFPRRQDQAGVSYALSGEVPAIRVHELRERLPALTHGEGVLECEFHQYLPVRGLTPGRPRTDANPLNRKEYLLRVAHHVTAGA